MRLFFAITIIVLNSALGLGQEAEFSFDKTVHKFPDVKEGVVLEHFFVVKNTGAVPLVFSDYKVECSCTKVELPAHPIPPGEEYKLRVTFDTKGKYYFQDRIIYLTANTKKAEHKLRIKANVIPVNE